MGKVSYLLYRVVPNASDFPKTKGSVKVQIHDTEETVQILQDYTPFKPLSEPVGRLVSESGRYAFEEMTGSHVKDKSPPTSSTSAAASTPVSASSSSLASVPVPTPTSSPRSAPPALDTAASITDEQIRAFITRVCENIYWLVNGSTYDCQKSSKNLKQSLEQPFSAYVTDGKTKHKNMREMDGYEELPGYIKREDFEVDEFENLYWIYVLSRLYNMFTPEQKKKTLFTTCGIDVKILKNLEKTGDLTFTYTERGIISNTTYKITVEDSESNKARIAEVENATTVEQLLELLPAEPATTAGRRGHRRPSQKTSRRRRRQGFTLPMTETGFRKRSRRTHSRR
jgi:hypothetical protein